VAHPEAAKYAVRAHYSPYVSFPIVAAQWHFIVRRPAAYFRMWRDILVSFAGKPKLLVQSVALVPKVVLFARQMQNEGVEHVHAHFAAHPTTAAWIVGRLTGIPYSFTAHAYDLYVDQHMLREKIRSAQFVITISHLNRIFMIDNSGPEFRDKIRVLHCGADLTLFQPVVKTEEHTRFRIVCVGALEEKKGHTHLVRACSLLKLTGVKFDCRLIGDGPLLKRLQQQVHDEDLEDVIKFEGGLPRQKVAQLIQSADVVVQPSVRTASRMMEGIPVALMEAMACEVPVIATRLSGVPELVEDAVTGLLVPQADADEMAGAMKAIYDDRELARKLGRNARQKVMREFDLAANAGVLADLFLDDAPGYGSTSEPSVAKAQLVDQF